MWVKCCCEEAWHDEGGAKHEERAPEGAGLAADGTRTRKTRLLNKNQKKRASRVDRSLTAQRVRLTTRAGSSLAESAPVRYLDVAHPDWPAGLRGTLLALSLDRTFLAVGTLPKIMTLGCTRVLEACLGV